VLATLEDLHTANRLISTISGSACDPLLPQTRLLLEQLDAYVTRRAGDEQLRREQVRFTQRQVREALQWSDRALRRQLARLVQLEYVLAYRTGRGNGRTYQLLYDGQGPPSSWQLALADPRELGSGEPHSGHLNHRARLCGASALKSEYRNPKSETNSNIPNSNDPNKIR
jgi:hypothetical protein